MDFNKAIGCTLGAPWFIVGLDCLEIGEPLHRMPVGPADLDLPTANGLDEVDEALRLDVRYEAAPYQSRPSDLLTSHPLPSCFNDQSLIESLIARL